MQYLYNYRIKQNLRQNNKYNHSLIFRQFKLTMTYQQNSAIQQQIHKIRNQKYFKIAGKINHQLLDQIQNQITQEKFVINDQKKPLALQKSSEKEAELVNRKLHDIIQKKQEMRKLLNTIQHQQLSIKKNSQLNLSAAHKSFRSQITEQQKIRIKKVRQALKKFQKELQNKTKTFQQKQKKYLQQVKQLQEKRKNQVNQLKRDQIQKHVQQINQRQAERLAKLQQDKKRMTLLKNKKYVFQQLQHKWKNHIEQQEKENQRAQEQVKKKNNLNFQQIQEHSKKYKQMMKKNKQERQKRTLQYSQVFQSKTGRYSPTKFHIILAEQDQKKKQQQEQRKNLIKKFNDKRVEYADKIRKQYKLKTIEKPIHQQTQQDKIKLPALRALSVLDMKKKGNQYMRQIHSNIGSVQIQKSKVSEPQSQKPKSPLKYKDYLKDAKLARTIKQGSPNNHRDLDQIKKIMRRQNTTQQQKFFKAKLIASKIEQKGGNTARKLVQSINAKIQILKQFAG